MKKLVLVLSLFASFLLSVNSVGAELFSCEEKLLPYIEETENINNQYGTEYYILSAEEYFGSELKEEFELTYQDYVKFIVSQDIDVFKKELIDQSECIITDSIEVDVEILSRSSAGTKSATFFDGRNRMTLKYKYNGSKFDTSYKPIATVSRISSSNYFQMTSYSGKFLNSNKTYRVYALGRIISTTGIANNRSFTVNFNL